MFLIFASPKSSLEIIIDFINDGPGKKIFDFLRVFLLCMYISITFFEFSVRNSHNFRSLRTMTGRTAGQTDRGLTK